MRRSPVRVLVVDDCEASRRQLGTLLRARGCRLDETGNALSVPAMLREAVRAMRRFSWNGEVWAVLTPGSVVDAVL